MKFWDLINEWQKGNLIKKNNVVYIYITAGYTKNKENMYPQQYNTISANKNCTHMTLGSRRCWHKLHWQWCIQGRAKIWLSWIMLGREYVICPLISSMYLICCLLWIANFIKHVELDKKKIQNSKINDFKSEKECNRCTQICDVTPIWLPATTGKVGCFYAHCK